MKRRTVLIVYVDAKVLKEPDELFQAVFAHLVKKGVDLKLRKRFIAEFHKAPTAEMQLEVIDNWMQVRDAANFMQRKEQDEGTKAEGGVPVDDGTVGEPESGAAPE